MLETLHSDLVVQACNDNFAALRYGAQPNRYKISVKNAGINHAVTLHAKEHVWGHTEKIVRYLERAFVILNGQQRLPSSDTANDRDAASRRRALRSMHHQDPASARQTTQNAVPLKRNHMLLRRCAVESEMLCNVFA